MANEVDISERWLLTVCKTAFEKLLTDHTTGCNIYWATDSYVERGEGFGFFDEITVDKIKDDEVIRPRVRKSAEEQTKRVKEKAEVFTPVWICNAQNNLVDDAWFGVAETFNHEYVNEDGNHCWEPTGLFKTSFGKSKSHKMRSWQQYVSDRRLEITCGEAPYLMSRYDAVSGDPIPPDRRVGMFDRKMQVINAFEDDPSKWMKRVHEAIRATYGFEWQGDSLLIARESMLLTIFDYFFEKFPEERPKEGSNYPINGKMVNRQTFSKFINNAAYFISWNLWQMDGLRYVLPGTSDKTYVCQKSTENLFGDEFMDTPETVKERAPSILDELKKSAPGNSGSKGIPAVVSDWKHTKQEPRKVFFASIINQKS